MIRQLSRFNSQAGLRISSNRHPACRFWSVASGRRAWRACTGPAKKRGDFNERWIRPASSKATETSLNGATCENNDPVCRSTNELELERLSYLLYVIPKHHKFTTEQLSANRKLLENARDQILNAEYDPKGDLDTAVRLFCVFLRLKNDPNFKVTGHLTEKLISADVQLNCEQAMRLLGGIKKNYLQHFQEIRQTSRPVPTLFPRVLSFLISKCNSTVYDSLSRETDADLVSKFLGAVHNRMDACSDEFSNFYDVKLLDLLVPYLVANIDSDDAVKAQSYNLMKNYSRIRFHDERLLKAIYESFLSDPDYWTERGSGYLFYHTTAQYRFPFVDYQRLASLVFDLSTASRMQSFNRALSRFPNASIQLLAELILTDVMDEKLLHGLVKKADELARIPTSEQIMNPDYSRYALARVYLKMFGKFEDEKLKLKIDVKLHQVLFQITSNNRHPQILDRLLNYDGRIQKNGYLSNGLFINQFAIYDKKRKKLVPLIQFRSHFDKVDKIPLGYGQELVTFIPSWKLQGDMKNYESTYRYQMKKVLKGFGFKPIDIFFEDYRKLSFKQESDFLVEKIIQSYRLWSED